MQIDDMPLTTGVGREERLALERAARVYIQRIFMCVMSDRFDSALSVWDEVRAQGDWMQVAVFAALPNTLRALIREHEHGTRPTQ